MPFQFLIGTIKTYSPSLVSNMFSLVSIPYRYYKNFDCDGFVTNTKLFQFLIGTIKTI